MSGPLTIRCTQLNVNVNNYYVIPPAPPSSSVPKDDHPVQDDVDSFDWNGLNFDNLSFDFDEDDTSSTQFSVDEPFEGEDFTDSMGSAFTGLERMSTPFERQLVSETGRRGWRSASESATWSQTIIAPTPSYGYVTPLGKFLQEWNAPTYTYSRYHPYGTSKSPETNSSRTSSFLPLRRAVWRSVTHNSTWHAQISSAPDVDSESPWPQGQEAMFPAVSDVFSEAFTADFTWPCIPPGAISTYSSLAGALGYSPAYSSPSVGSPSSQSSSSPGLDSWDDSGDSGQTSTPA
ncbi:hypothetical protein BDN71DRAFT_1509636 [Pleurotus eryngii]|uniref:Uncharacterized protein n=1 Tax=Pleurotus eryngii TaxID=5323 RepID=A0A9P5ZRD8_PLEER|nr:hypothetical protein BDN71DRAFT_1509636 [Pleurotus eryngii]